MSISIETRAHFVRAEIALADDPENPALGAYTAGQVWVRDVDYLAGTDTVHRTGRPRLLAAGDMSALLGYLGPTDAPGLVAGSVAQALALGGAVLADGLDVALMDNATLTALKAAVDAEVTSRGF